MPRYVTMRAKQGGYWLRFDYNRDVVNALKDLPSYTRRWNPEMKAWWVHEAWIDHAKKIVEQDPSFEYSYGYDEEDVSDYDTFEDFVNGKKREPEPEPPPRTMFGESLCFATLHLLPSAPLEVVKAAYGALSKLHHPDLSSDPTEKTKRHKQMCDINDAYEQAERIARARR